MHVLQHDEIVVAVDAELGVDQLMARTGMSSACCGLKRKPADASSRPISLANATLCL